MSHEQIIDKYLDGCNAILIRHQDGSVTVSCPEDSYEFSSLSDAVEMMRETIAIWESLAR